MLTNDSSRGFRQSRPLTVCGVRDKERRRCTPSVPGTPPAAIKFPTQEGIMSQQIQRCWPAFSLDSIMPAVDTSPASQIPKVCHQKTRPLYAVARSGAARAGFTPRCADNLAPDISGRGLSNATSLMPALNADECAEALGRSAQEPSHRRYTRPGHVRTLPAGGGLMRQLYPRASVGM